MANLRRALTLPLLVSILAPLAACGEDAPAAAPEPTTTTTVSPSTEARPTEPTSVPAETAPAATPEPASASADVAALVPQRVHRTLGASYTDPDGRFTLYWSRRVVALHEADTGRARWAHYHGTSGDVFFAAFWPTLDRDVVLGATNAGGDPAPTARGHVYVIHVATGRIDTVETPRWAGASGPVALGPARVVVGSTVVTLATGHTRELDLSLTPAERARPEDEDEDEYEDEGEDEGEDEADSDDEAARFEDDPVCVAAISQDRRHLALRLATGRIVLFDATTLERTGAVPRPPDAEDWGYCSGGERAVYRPGSDRLVTTGDGGHLVEVSPDGSVHALPLPEDARGDFVLSLDAPTRVRFEYPSRVFSLDDGAEIAVAPDDPTRWPEEEPRWTGTADPELDDGDLPPGNRYGGEHAIWNVAFAPGAPLLVTGGRGGVFRWSADGAASISCLTGERPIVFGADGRAHEPGSGRCDVRTGAGRAGGRDDPESGIYYDPDCFSLSAYDGETERYFRYENGVMYPPAEPGAPAGHWDSIVRTFCDGRADYERALDNTAGADPTRAVFTADNRLVAMPVPAGTRIWELSTAAPLVTISGGASLLGESASGAFLFVRRDRDAHVALITRRGAETRLDAGEAPALDCEPEPVAERGDLIAVHTTAGVRLLDAETLAVRAEIDAPGTCRMELTDERVLVRRGEQVLTFSRTGEPTGTLSAPEDFRASDDGTALYRCAGGVLEVRDSATGAARARWTGACADAVLSRDASLAVVRDVGRSRARLVRVADGASLVLGMHYDEDGPMRPFAFAPATGVFWAPDDTPHDLFGVRVGPRVLDDPLLTGEEAWTRFHRPTLLADFFAGRPLPAPTAAP